MSQNDIEDMLYHLRRIKREGNFNSVKIDQIETLEMELRFLRTFVKYHHVRLPDYVVNIAKKAQLIVEMLQSVFGGISDECKTNLNVERLVSYLLEFVQDNTISRCNFELNDSYLLEYIDCLDKNLSDAPRHLGRSGPPSTGTIEILEENQFFKKVKILQRKMRFLIYLYATEIKGYIDHEKLEALETRIQVMADNVRQFCLTLWGSYQDEDEDEDDTADEILCLIMLVQLEMQKIFLVELKTSKFSQSRTCKKQKLPKGFLVQLCNLLVYLRDQNLENSHNNVSAQNIDVAIEFLLFFLDDVPNRVIYGKSLNEVLKEVGSLVSDIAFVVQKLLSSSTINDDTTEIDLGSIQLLKKVENLKTKVEERYYKSLKFIPSQFPRFGGLSFLDSLLRKLNEMLKSDSNIDLMMKPHIGVLEKDLSSLTPLFRDTVKVHHQHEILKDLQRRIINLAYEAEVAIDSILVQYNPLWHLFCSLPTILKEIKHISEEVTKLWYDNLSLKSRYVVEPPKHPPTRHRNPVKDEEIVGFEIAEEKLIQYVTRGTNKLDVIPIVGMGGQGKTTCARKMYTNDIIVSHFDVRAWCIISQAYNRRQLLQDIFSQVTSSSDKGDKDDILADMLKKHLRGKRYLIVLDDMWDGMAWDDLRLSFPDVGNRSRIVITTRLEKVGEHVMHHTDPYFLPFLTPEESCRLLQKKVFEQEVFPPELKDVSLAVAKRCKGLPLVVVLAAGIIKKWKMEESWWHEVENDLFSCLGKSKEYSLETMQLSYNNLPDYLRPCLLYMGMFPEDHAIPVSKLISLWIAEGFVQNNESGILEEAAEDYLKDLISSSMLMVSSRSYNGKVKYCQVHDVVLHFCLEKSREEKFLMVVKGDYSYFHPSNWKESRINLNFIDKNSKMRIPSHQHVRSLTATDGRYDLCDIFRLVSKFRLLKVLDLSFHNVRALLSATLKPLIHLKYLKVSADKFDFHPELHLPQLETLIVYNHFKCQVPVIFWKMEKLRRVEVTYAKFDLENNKQLLYAESSKLENLRTLKGVVIEIGDADNVDVILRRCPNLQEIDIFLWGKEDSAEFCPKWENVTQLQILRLFVESSLIVSKLQFPLNLNKLVLHSIPIENNTISVMAGLPNLEYLELSAVDFLPSEQEWFLGDITFHKLKVLKLVCLDISRWDASEESFPLLETLTITGCDKLKEIPLSFADIPTLKQIMLITRYYNNANSLEASAKKIKEEIEVIEGCDRLNLYIIK